MYYVSGIEDNQNRAHQTNEKRTAVICIEY